MEKIKLQHLKLSEAYLETEDIRLYLNLYFNTKWIRIPINKKEFNELMEVEKKHIIKI